MTEKWGCLLINLGTPSAPNPKAVGTYLTEFLSDPEVIDLPFLARQALVRLIIVPFRKRRSSKLYQSIWTPEGSPLDVHSRALRNQVQDRIPAVTVQLGYRYGHPNLEEALRELEAQKVRRIFVLPLYPQYATSTTKTVALELDRLNIRDRFQHVRWIQSFHAQEFYIDSLASTIRQVHAPESHLLFSFHGIPIRHISKNHPGCAGCELRSPCLLKGDSDCYHRQCYETAVAVAKALNLKPECWSLSFQSRLGRAEWLGPATSSVLKSLPSRGVDRVTVVAPGFVSDCLETLEELDVEGRDLFLQSGGSSWNRVPCLNSDPAWIQNLSRWIFQNIEEAEHG